MRKVRNRSVVMAAKLPHRMMWTCPLPKKPPSSPMVLAGGGVTWGGRGYSLENTGICAAWTFCFCRKKNTIRGYYQFWRQWIWQLQILAGEMLKSRPYKKTTSVSCMSQTGKQIYICISDGVKPCQILTQAVTYLQSQPKEKVAQELWACMLGK